MIEHLDNAHPKFFDNNISMSNTKQDVELLINILRQFSKILSLASPENPELSNVINKLVDIFSRFKDRPIDEVLNGLTIAKKADLGKSHSKLQKVISESEAKSLSLEEIEKLLESKDLSKNYLVTIARFRFGMPSAELMKTRKEDVIMAIKTAVSNLRTIHIIGKQAAGE